jgi:squalene-associated FAD-dependent desaturase
MRPPEAQRHVAIVGAGLAGLAAACALANSGVRVTLFERRPWAGGKAYSFVERETGALVDNGQHIFMRCTTAYVAFLRRLGTLGLTRRQRRLHVPVFDARGRRSDLWAAPLPPPLHLGPAFAAYRHLAAADKARVAWAIMAMQRLAPSRREELNGITLAAWLRGHGQSDTAIAGFWDLIIVPTLNARSADVSAAQALFVFQEGFLKSAEATAIGLPAVPLSRLHVEPALAYVRRHGGEVRLGCGVHRIEVEDGAVCTLVTTSGERVPVDACIVAVPPRRVGELLPERYASLPPFAALAVMPVAPIVNLHLWFDGPVAPFTFAAFTGCELQWVFNQTRIALAPESGSEHLAVSLSAAGAYIEMSKGELLARFLPQIEAALPAARGRKLLRAAVIKEPDATFVPVPGLKRPGVVTPVRGLYLAGAYTATGWPATMESAVRSGEEAAQAALAAPAMADHPRHR